MPTTKTRINLAVPKKMKRELTRVAAREELPLASATLLLLHRALELDEDAALEEIALEREKRGGRLLSHKEVWG